MIGLDANVVVRYLTQDDRVQASVVNRLFERELSDAEPGYLSTTALVEVIWVLETGYSIARGDVAVILDKLLRSRIIVIENTESVTQALRMFRDGTADFADCLIERAGRLAGCNRTLTFDKIAARDAGMTLLTVSKSAH